MPERAAPTIVKTTVIKKYVDRRLYNTGTAAYVTLEDLAGMIRKREDFIVYDAASREDITRSIVALISSPLTEH